jgi:hypothetical protein
MDRRLLLLLALSVGCAQGSLEGPGSFGLPTGATMTTQADTGDDEGETEDETDEDGDGDGDTGPSTQSSTDPSTDTAMDDSSSSAPITTAEDSSDGSASLDDSASAEDSSSSDASASASATNSDDGASMDDGVEPPPEVGPWENCEAATCEVGTDCLTVNGVAGEAYCSPQCIDDLDCPYADTGDATPFCLLVDEGDVDPSNCTLVCEVDGLDYGTCPTGMTCTSVPGQDPSVSLCMW